MWQHKKYKSQFKGSYAFAKGDRVFQLTSGKKVVSFESWEAAKKAGWSKV